jgi:biopolymer transport protein ExbB
MRKKLSALGVACLACVAAWARAGAVSPSPATAPGQIGGLWALFVQSFDVFTVLLVAGSVVCVAVIIACALELRASRMLPRGTINRLEDLAASGRWEDLRAACAADGSLVSRIVEPAVLELERGPRAVRDAAELAAAEETARAFRSIEILNIIGNLGPLVGLAGTVWGMILAFTSLGESAGRAGPADLSLGISKALFHTLLGLCLAIPALLAFGLLRSRADRICTRGVVVASRIVERLVSVRERLEPAPAPAARG